MAGFEGKAGATALALVLATLASPAAGQTVVVTVDYPTFFVSDGSVVQERGLSEPVPPPVDVNAINRQEAIDLANRLNQQLSQSGTCAIRYEVVNGTRVQRVPGPFLVCGTFASGTSSALERRIFDVQIVQLIDNRIGSPGDVQLRGISPENLALTITARDLARARAELALQSRSSLQRRHFVGVERFTGGGPVITTDRVISEVVTGRDRTNAVTGSVGGPGTFIVTGTRTNCPSSSSTIGCTGGVEVEVLAGNQNVNILVFTTLYITQSIERTLTGGTTFFDVPLTPLPSGAVHALAAQGALGGGQRFLDRLGDHAALVDRRGLWGDIEGVRQRFDAAGPLARSAVDGLAIRLGFDLAAAPGLTLGLAGEYASDDLAVADTITPESGSLDRWSLGAHARLEQGRVTASLAAMAGRVEADTSGASDLGAALGNYDATLYGVAARIGVELGDGPLRAIPEIGASWTMWDREAFAETGGPAPLAVAEASDQQTRLWGGGRLQWQGGSEQRRIGLSAYGRAVRVTGDRTPLITAIDPQLQDLPMVTAGPTVGKTRAEYGANATLRLGAGTMELGWDGSSGNGADANTIRATVRIPF